MSVVRWFVASLADGQTHLAKAAGTPNLVIACCDGRRFRPLAVLIGEPPDDKQACPVCSRCPQRVTRTPAAPAATLLGEPAGSRSGKNGSRSGKNSV